MKKSLLLVFAGLALSVASAETFHVRLFQSSVGQGGELRAGEYQMDLNHDQLVIRNGKQKLLVPVTVENAGQTFHSTRVLYTQENGKYSVREIQLGGTQTKVRLEVPAQSGGGQ